MKKITTVLIFVIFLAPLGAYAMTPTDINQLISAYKKDPTVLGASTNGVVSNETRSGTLTTPQSKKVLTALKYAKGKSAIIDKPIVVGSTDREGITILQQFLIAKGYLTVDANGIFGPLTRAALRKYQIDHGIKGGDGTRVGPATMTAISADITANTQY